MRSSKQKASAQAFKESLRKKGEGPPKAEPPKESWWLKPNFYEEAKKEAKRMEGGKLAPVND